VYRISEKTSDWQRSVYVGQSSNLQRRIYNYHLMGTRHVSTLRRKLIKSDRYADDNAVKQYLRDECLVQFVTMPEDNERTSFEHFAVTVLKPRYND